MVYLVIVFGGLSVAFLLLVYIHDVVAAVVAAYFARRAERASPAEHAGDPSSLRPTRTRTAVLRPQRTPQPLAPRGEVAVKDRYSDLSSNRPSWLDSAQRDVANR